MPCEPRLFDPANPDEGAKNDIRLPPDLVALAEQLSDDAVHLSRRFPAQATTAAWHKRRPHRREWIAAACIFLACSVSWYVSGKLLDPGGQLPSEPSFGRTIGTGSWLASGQIDNSVEMMEWFDGLSGPEREAVLDFFEEEPAIGVTTVSLSL